MNVAFLSAVCPAALRLGELLSVNLLLSGDNAVVAALVIRRLPPREKRWAAVIGIFLGTALQIAATLTLSVLLQLPMLSLLGGLALGVIAARLLDGKEPPLPQNDQAYTRSKAILTLAFAYVVVSADNILAVAAIGRGHPGLIVSALILSSVLLIPGSLLIARTAERYPAIAVACAIILAWTSGAMIAKDSLAQKAFAMVGFARSTSSLAVPIVLITIVLGSFWWRMNSDRGST